MPEYVQVRKRIIKVSFVDVKLTKYGATIVIDGQNVQLRLGSRPAQLRKLAKVATEAAERMTKTEKTTTASRCAQLTCGIRHRGQVARKKIRPIFAPAGARSPLE